MWDWLIAWWKRQKSLKPPPNPPTNVTITLRKSVATLTWKDPTMRADGTTPLPASQIASVKTMLSKNGGATYAMAANIPPGVQQAWVTLPTPTTVPLMYLFTLHAIDTQTPALASADTAVISVTVPVPVAPDTVPPSVPPAFTAKRLSATAVQLTWGDSVDTGGSGLAKYELYRDGVLIASPAAP
jgi:hypothetical protein